LNDFRGCTEALVVALKDGFNLQHLGKVLFLLAASGHSTIWKTRDKKSSFAGREWTFTDYTTLHS
jgi:hypothetical protein